MFIKTKIALSAAIVLSNALTASVATKLRRLAVYHMVPDNTSRDLSIQSGAPLRTAPDGW